MVAMTLMIIIAPQIDIIRNASRYLVHIMLGFFGLGFLFLIVDKRKLIFTCFGLSAMLCVFLKDQSNMDLVSPLLSKNPKIEIININLGNAEDGLGLIDVISNHQADIWSFQELTPDWADIISKALETRFPYKFVQVRIDPYGKAIYSKFPIKAIDTIKFENHYDVGADILVEDKPFHIVSSYLIPALNKTSLSKARRQLSLLSDNVASHQERCLVFGEFNMVYWDEEIIRFRTENSLNNSRKDIMPTTLRVPFDHIFYSEDLNCIQFKDVISSGGTKYGSSGTYQIKNLSPAKDSSNMNQN